MQTIFYGAPGTGKSYTIDTNILSGVDDAHIFRITFYPDFSYSDFVGQLLPTVLPPSTPGGTSTITYEFQKGVFTLALEKAYENNAEDVYLVIEEMSRGDCAAIFGDIFQLLDRKKTGADRGYSRYFINNKMISKDIIALPGDTVKLPANFHILGTINTSDQNVFVMDTAFKRRFDWEYVSPSPVPVVGAPGTYENDVDLQINDGSTIRTIKWVELYQKLNEFIANDSYLDLGEDKQLGPFFIEFYPAGSTADYKKAIQNKLLNYLWTDVHKASFKSDVRLFKTDIGTFKKLYEEFEADRQIFSDEFLSIL
jgi:llaI.2